MSESMSLSNSELDDNDVDELEVETVDDGRSTKLASETSSFAVSSSLRSDFCCIFVEPTSFANAGLFLY